MLAEVLLLAVAAVGLVQGYSQHQLSSMRRYPISRNNAAATGRLPGLVSLPRATVIQKAQSTSASLSNTVPDIGKPAVASTAEIIDGSDFRRFLQMPSVSAVKLPRLSPLDASCLGWQLGDSSVECTVQDVISGSAECLDDMCADTSSILPFAPKAARMDMCRLLYSFATSVLETGLAEPSTQLQTRLRVTDPGGPSCPRLHCDKVNLRLVCAYQGEGTTWLPDHAVNRAALRWLTNASNGNVLRASLSQSTPVYNKLVRWPWEREQQTPTGDILLLKGFEYSTFLDEQDAHAFVPAIHRTPSSALGAAPPGDQLGSSRRALFTVDF